MSVTRPRGPLPARVYWTRRVLVLLVALGLVFGFTRLIGGSPDESPAPAAQPASGPVTTDADPQAVSTDDARPTPTPNGKNRTEQPLAMPTGPCPDSDVKIVPTVLDTAYAGEDVRLTLELWTFESPACNWEVSPESVAVKLTSGSDRIWTSQECPAVVPTEAVTLRQQQPTLVEVVWSGRRSDAECSRMTQWAQPGWYHVAAAAMGSEPESRQFELRSPAPITITPTPTPTPKSERQKQRQQERQDDE